MKQMTAEYVKNNVTIEVLQLLPETTRIRVLAMLHMLRRDWNNSYDADGQISNVYFQARNIKATIRRYPEAWAIFGRARKTPDDHLRDAAAVMRDAIERILSTRRNMIQAVIDQSPTLFDAAQDDVEDAVRQGEAALAKARGEQP